MMRKEIAAVAAAIVLAACASGAASDTRDQETIDAANQFQKLSDAHSAAMGRANDQLNTVKSFDEKVAAFFHTELDAEKAFDAGLANIPFPSQFQSDGRVMLEAGQQLEKALPILIVEAQAGQLTAGSDDMKQWGVGIDTWKQADAKMRHDLGLTVPAYDAVSPSPS
jgi:hypothetical protein